MGARRIRFSGGQNVAVHPPLQHVLSIYIRVEGLAPQALRSLRITAYHLRMRSCDESQVFVSRTLRSHAGFDSAFIPQVYVLRLMISIQMTDEVAGCLFGSLPDLGKHCKSCKVNKNHRSTNSSGRAM